MTADLITVPDCARRLGCSVRFLQAWLAGQVGPVPPHERRGRAALVDPMAVYRHIEKHNPSRRFPKGWHRPDALPTSPHRSAVRILKTQTTSEPLNHLEEPEPVVTFEIHAAHDVDLPRNDRENLVEVLLQEYRHKMPAAELPTVEVFLRGPGYGISGHLTPDTPSPDKCECQHWTLEELDARP